MAGFLMTLKGLPSTYNKDLQEDKEPLFDTVDNVSACFRIAEGVVATLDVSLFSFSSGSVFTVLRNQVHKERMEAALTMDVLATDLADYLVRKGVSLQMAGFKRVLSFMPFRQTPFRETHHISGRAVALAESRKCQLNDLTLEDYKNLSDKFSEDVHGVFDFEASVERRNAIGGPSREMVSRQIEVLRKAVADK